MCGAVIRAVLAVLVAGVGRVIYFAAQYLCVADNFKPHISTPVVWLETVFEEGIGDAVPIVGFYNMAVVVP